MFTPIRPQAARNEFGEVVSVKDRYTISLRSENRQWLADVEFGVGIMEIYSSSLREVLSGGVAVSVEGNEALRVLSLLKEGMDCLGSECVIAP